MAMVRRIKEMEEAREKVPDHYRYVIADVLKPDTDKVTREMISGNHNAVQWSADKGTFAGVVQILWDTIDYSEDAKEAMVFGLQRASILQEEEIEKVKLVCNDVFFCILAAFCIFATSDMTVAQSLLDISCHVCRNPIGGHGSPFCKA